MKQYRIVPTSPHSDKLRLAAWNSPSIYFRTAKFDPAGCTGLTTLQGILLKSVEMGKPAEQLKELSADEKTAFQTYIPTLMSLISTMRACQCVHDEAPATIPGMVSGTDFVLTLDDFKTIKEEINLSNLSSIAQLEDFVCDIVASQIILEDKDDRLYLPGSKLNLFIPFKTLANIRSYLAVLISNSHLFTSYCKKMSLSLTSLNIDKVCSKPGAVMRAQDWGNFDYQFWALNAWLNYKNATDAGYIIQSNYAQAIPAFTDANWLQYLQYVYKQGETPHAYNAIIRLFYPYGAVDNLIGCTEIVDQLCLGMTDAFANGDFAIGYVAVNGTDFDWVLAAAAHNLLAVIPGIGTENATLNSRKDIDSSPAEMAIGLEQILPPEFKIHLFGPETGLWDVTNYNAEFMYFTNLLQTSGTGKKRSPARDKWKPKRKVIHTVGEDGDNEGN